MSDAGDAARMIRQATDDLMDAHIAAIARIQKLEAALTKIADFDDVGANAYLAASGSYGRFDEPGSVCTARIALNKEE